MNAASWIALFIIAVAFALAVLRIFKGKHSGCCGGCNGCNKPLAQSQVAPSAGLARPVVDFVNESAVVNSVTEQLSFRLTAEPLLKDFRKLTVLLDGG